MQYNHINPSGMAEIDVWARQGSSIIQKTEEPGSFFPFPSSSSSDYGLRI